MMDKQVKAIYKYLLSTKYTYASITTRVVRRELYFSTFPEAKDHISQYVKQEPQPWTSK